MVRFASFFGSDSTSHFHSNTMADTSAQKPSAATRLSSFSQRLAINKNRQHVQSYQDAGILHTYRTEAHDKKVIAQEQSVDQVASNDQHSDRPLPKQVVSRSSRIDVVRPTRQGFNATNSPSTPTRPTYQRQSFSEPASRKYNPFA